LKEQEALRMELEPLWSAGLGASEIARQLSFGVVGSRWEKLKPYHVYFYRRIFKLNPRRQRKSGVSRYKVKQQEVMNPEEFIKVLDSKLSKDTFQERRQRAYLILHYWTPLRKSEIYERPLENFEINKKEQVLTIHLFRKKKKATEEEPLDTPLAFPLMNEVIEYLEGKEWEMMEYSRPFDFSPVTAWRYVKDVFGDYYPHFFRFNYITDRCSDPETSLTELRAKTGLSISSLNKYLMRARRAQRSADQRKLEELKSKGLLKGGE